MMFITDVINDLIDVYINGLIDVLIDVSY